MVVNLQKEISSFFSFENPPNSDIVRTKEKEDKGSPETKSGRSGSPEVVNSIEQDHEYVGLGFERRGMGKVLRMWNNFDTLSIWGNVIHFPLQ